MLLIATRPTLSQVRQIDACDVGSADVAVACTSIFPTHHDHWVEVVRVVHLITTIHATVTSWLQPHLVHVLYLGVISLIEIALVREVLLDVEVGVVGQVLSCSFSLGMASRGGSRPETHHLVHLRRNLLESVGAEERVISMPLVWVPLVSGILVVNITASSFIHVLDGLGCAAQI